MESSNEEGARADLSSFLLPSSPLLRSTVLRQVCAQTWSFAYSGGGGTSTSLPSSAFGACSFARDLEESEMTRSRKREVELTLAFVLLPSPSFLTELRDDVYGAVHGGELPAHYTICAGLTFFYVVPFLCVRSIRLRPVRPLSLFPSPPPPSPQTDSIKLFWSAVNVVSKSYVTRLTKERGQLGAAGGGMLGGAPPSAL